jgi:hypothetical protein
VKQRPIVLLLVVGWLHGCATCPPDVAVETRDYGVNFDLLDVAAQGGDGFALMVGEGGRVVRRSGGETDVFAFEPGVSLCGVAVDGSSAWVVGDDGFVAFTDDGAQTWQVLDSGTQADLRAVAPIDAGVAVVGDGVVLILQDGAWTVPPTPPSGWGELLEVVQSHPPNGTGRVFAVGRGGVVWSAQDVAGEWSLEDVGVTADLVAAGDFDGEIIAVGERGTALRRDESGTWARLNTGVKADFVDLGFYALTENGYLGGFMSSGRFKASVRSVGAKRHSGLLLVGDGGFVSAIVFGGVCE